MQDNNSLLFQLEQMLHWKKSRNYYAKRLNITEGEVEELLKELKGKENTRNEAETAAYIDALEERIIEVNNERGTLKSTVNCDFEPKSDEELAKLHKIDTLRYKISNYWSKVKGNGKFTSSVFATLRKPSDYTAEDFAKFLQNYTPKKVEVAHILDIESYDREIVDVEISIADFHLAKKTLEGETISTKKDQFLSTLRDLAYKVHSCYTIKKIVFPISNDFFHTDNYQNSTTNGTPQDVLVDYNHEYEEGFDLLVEAISFLCSMCQQVEVVLVQGNHDRTKSFYLAHGLEVFFRDGYNVTFQRHHSTTKSVVLGNTFIGYHHGNCKIEDLPLVFATGNDSVNFGMAKYREVHTGDKHHYMAKEIKGVRIQQMPSLSGTDRWHSDNNYVNNIRSGLALVYHKELGKVAEFESRL